MATVTELQTQTESLSLHSVPDIETFDAHSYNLEDVIKAMIVGGGAIIKNVLSPEDLIKAENEVRPYLDQDVAFQGGFFPEQTRRVHGLVGKSPTVTMKIIGNELYQKVSDHFLTDTYTCWNGTRKDTMVSKPQLNCTNVFAIGPGARDQELHRDDMIHHNRLSTAITPDQYEIGRDVGIGFFVAGTRTTKENGATRFIPGSHLWALDEPPVEELCVYAEMEPGDGVLMLSSCYHGGSANKTEKEERLVYGIFNTKGYLRQEENQYLANDIEVVKSYPLWIQRFIGYSISPPSLGWIDLKDPIKHLHPDMDAQINPY